MATTRMTHPNNAVATSFTIAGRTYTCPANGTVDVPDFDASVMEANGFVTVALGGVTSTVGRPPAPFKNMEILDSTLGYVIRFDGIHWRNLATGAVV